MPWGRLDDTLYDHAKVEALAPSIRLACVGLQALAISWSNRQLTDGIVPDKRIATLGGTKKHRDELVRVGMWEETEGGIAIHDFLHYNKSREQVIAERDAARERMAAKRRRSGEVHANVQPNNGRSSDELPAKFARSSDDVRAPRARESRPAPSRRDSTPPTPSPARGRRERTKPLSARAQAYEDLVERDDPEPDEVKAWR